MISRKSTLVFSLILIVVACFSLNAAWYEAEDMSVGNFREDCGDIHEIPKSHWGIGGKPASKAMPDEKPP